MLEQSELIPVVKFEEKVSDKLYRCYVGIVNAEDEGLVRRRSVVLCHGVNNVQLTWQPTLKIPGTPAFAVLYNKNGVWVGRAPFLEPANFIRAVDTITLTWRIPIYDGSVLD
jgi:hypothetical protein